MPTLEQIWSQINALPHRYIFYTKKEINYLPQILGEGEKILALTSGFMQNRTWLAVCTDRRILFLDRGMFFGLRQVQINLDRLQTIESDTGLCFGTIRVADAGSSMAIGMVLKPSVAPFVRTVQDAMDHYKRTMVHDLARASSNALSSAAPAATANKTAFVGELESLAKLKADGHLSDAEYAAAKAKLLGH
jgi:hypothetical protein